MLARRVELAAVPGRALREGELGDVLCLPSAATLLRRPTGAGGGVLAFGTRHSVFPSLSNSKQVVDE